MSVTPPAGEGAARSPEMGKSPVRWLIRTIEWLVMFLMGIIVALVVVEVGLRWLAGGASLIVHEELTRYLMIWTVMLGAALLVYEDGHIRIGILSEAVPPTVGKIFYVLSQLVVLFFLGILIITSLGNLPQMTGQNTITLPVSMAWFFAALPVGGALMFVLVLYDMYEKLGGTRLSSATS